MRQSSIGQLRDQPAASRAVGWGSVKRSSGRFLLLGSPWLVGLVIVAGWLSGAHADRAQARDLFERGVALERAGEVERALQHYEQAIAEDADFAPAYERAAPLWIQRNSFDTARRALERFTLRHPRHAFAWYALAYVYRRRGQAEYAALSYESYIDLRPGEAAPYFGLGMVRLDIGDRRGARHAFERYVQLERDHARMAFVEQARLELARLADGAAPAIGAPPTAASSARTSPAPAGEVRESPDGRERTSAATARRTSGQTQEQTPRPSEMTPGPTGATPGTTGATPGQARSGLTDDGSSLASQVRHVSLSLAEGRHQHALALAQTIRPKDEREALTLAMWRARIHAATGDTEQARELLWAILAAVPTHVGALRLLLSLP